MPDNSGREHLRVPSADASMAELASFIIGASEQKIAFVKEPTKPFKERLRDTKPTKLRQCLVGAVALATFVAGVESIGTQTDNKPHRKVELTAAVSAAEIAPIVTTTVPKRPPTTAAPPPPSTLPPATTTTTPPTTMAPKPPTTIAKPFLKQRPSGLWTYSSFHVPAGAEGNDISWPNGSGLPASSQFAIIGVTGGKNFKPNRMLPAQTAEAASKHLPFALYVNADYPGKAAALPYIAGPKICVSTNEDCLAYNYGYNGGIYAVDTVARHHIMSNSWWIDAETGNAWSDNLAANRSSIQGQSDAIRAMVPRYSNEPVTIGYYSTNYQWGLITGGWRNGAPVWYATGQGSQPAAQTYCPERSGAAYNFTGAPNGPSISQYQLHYALPTGDTILDTNTICTSF